MNNLTTISDLPQQMEFAQFLLSYHIVEHLKISTFKYYKNIVPIEPLF